MALVADPYKPEVRVSQRRTFGGGFEEIEQQPTSTEELIESLERDIGEYRQSVESLGTSLDSSGRRQELPRLREGIEAKIGSVKQDLEAKKAGGVGNIIVRRISDRLQNQVDTFNYLTSKEKDRIMSATNDILGDDGDLGRAYLNADSAVHEQQQDLGLEIREREAQEMRALERDVQDLHEINKDMNVMIHQQGDDIGRIETHTEKAAVTVEHGTANTEGIRVLKWKNRKMRFIIGGCLIASVVTLVLLILIIVVSAVCGPPGGPC